MTGEDGKRAVNLLGGDGTGQFMRESDAAKGPGVGSDGESRRAPTIRRADAHQKALRATVTQMPYSIGDLGRSKECAAGVEQDQLCRWACRPPVRIAFPFEEQRGLL